MEFLKNPAGEFFFRPILMQFAAHQVGVSYRDFYLDHRILVDANLRCLETFGMDAVGLISDPYRETEAFGAHFHYPENSVPVCDHYPVRTLADVKSLHNPDLHKCSRTRDRIDGAALFAKRLGSAVPIIGWIEGPLAEACDLVGFSEMMLKLAMDPDFCRHLLEKTAKTAVDFAKAQLEAGCRIIGMGDAACSQISGPMYRKFVLPHHQEIIAEIHRLGGLVKLHICGNISHLLPDVKTASPDIVDLDWMVDMDKAYKEFGDGIIRCGNLDPVAVIERESMEQVSKRTKELLEKEQNRPFWLSGGCEITVGTPVENLRVMREVSR